MGLVAAVATAPSIGATTGGATGSTATVPATPATAPATVSAASVPPRVRKRRAGRLTEILSALEKVQVDPMYVKAVNENRAAVVRLLAPPVAGACTTATQFVSLPTGVLVGFHMPPPVRTGSLHEKGSDRGEQRKRVRLRASSLLGVSRVSAADGPSALLEGPPLKRRAPLVRRVSISRMLVDGPVEAELAVRSGGLGLWPYGAGICGDGLDANGDNVLDADAAGGGPRFGPTDGFAGVCDADAVCDAVANREVNNWFARSGAGAEIPGAVEGLAGATEPTTVCGAVTNHEANSWFALSGPGAEVPRAADGLAGAAVVCDATVVTDVVTNREVKSWFALGEVLAPPAARPPQPPNSAGHAADRPPAPAAGSPAKLTTPPAPTKSSGGGGSSGIAAPTVAVPMASSTATPRPGGRAEHWAALVRNSVSGALPPPRRGPRLLPIGPLPAAFGLPQPPPPPQRAPPPASPPPPPQTQAQARVQAQAQAQARAQAQAQADAQAHVPPLSSPPLGPPLPPPPPPVPAEAVAVERRRRRWRWQEEWRRRCWRWQ
eukprot:NODE_2241_length_2260_cov_3.670886.p2 GENE.NODE_2241_length_2260_cov_3.670886~~NODE_2241_length_2260_cov_3.670886.p2  ORF type:complete len:638 (-),score=192.64 NODE_2241_length_2260_cov_3.670886:347-1990(-)